MSAHTPPFMLIRANGETTEFATLVALGLYVRAHKITVAAYHVRHITYAQLATSVVRDEWIARDDDGNVVYAAEIKDATRQDWNSYRDRRRSVTRHAMDLGLPIPHTGKKRFFYINVLRQPRHASAWREDAACGTYADELAPQHVARFRVKRPPNPWDDIPRSNHNGRCWKHYRSHQYRPVED